MINSSGKILVVCDPKNYLSDHMKQMISKAYQLSQENGHMVCVLFIGQSININTDEFAKYGADVLYYGTSEKVQTWDYCDLIERIIEEITPKLVMFQATEFGRAVAATLSSRLEYGLTADCIDVTYNCDDGYVFSRAALCDSVVAQITGINCEVNMGTIKDGVFQMGEVAEPKAIEVHKVKLDIKALDSPEKCLKVESIESVKEEININDFSTVFCIGRGACSTKCIEGINVLAKKYNACVAATRPVVEDGIVDRSMQVGQSGKSISPKLYIAFGVSGASQHLVGMKNSDIVVAVNTDPNAPIFDYANYAVVADAYEIIQEMNK